MSFTTLFSFWAFSLVFVFTPGADWAYAISAGIRGKGIIPAVVGLLTGYVVLTGIIATGIGLMVSQNTQLMSLLTIGGGGYLAWLGVTTLRNPPVPYASGSPIATESSMRWFTKGFLVSGFNPKALLFFMAFLLPWTSTESNWEISTQIIVLASIHIASCTVVYTLVAVGSRYFLSARPKVAKRVGSFSGAIMLCLGISILFKFVI
ncbi:LysE family translocator [Methylophilus sp. QUAN]|uniref:LysE family translocator n=1 Tax=Methylophilus sp. QUAN TaxID=2781020 RepID=UPI00188FCF99|nr:LysE family translocator [Methylophilus sp. QUAN]MBF4990498.1 LysE family translocator [Methylophilus sp. QUAN]